MAETFETNLEKLQEIVETLEGGNIGLEESLKVFEAGIKLSQTCQKELNKAEKKIEILIKKDGEIQGKESLEN